MRLEEVTAANDLLQAGFRYVCEATNAAERVSTDGRRVRKQTTV